MYVTYNLYMVTEEGYYKLRHLFFIAALVSLTFNVPAMAGTATYDSAAMSKLSVPKTEDFTYQFHWVGIKFGKAFVRWDETDTTYKARMTLDSSGVAKFFTKQKRTLEVEGIKKVAADGSVTYVPQKSSSLSWKPKKQRKIDIVYDAEGNVETAVVTPADNRATRPDVEQLKKDAALDIMTAVLNVHAAAANEKTQTKSLVYDGRRLTEAKFTKATLTKDEQKKWSRLADPQKFTAKRKAVEGYTQKEIGRMAKGEPELIVFIDPTKSRMPFQVYADTKFGRITASR